MSRFDSTIKVTYLVSDAGWERLAGVEGRDSRRKVEDGEAGGGGEGFGVGRGKKN